MRSLELRVPPLALFAIGAAAMFALSWLVPAANVAVRGRAAIAIAVAAAGVLVALAGVVAFRRHKTTVNPVAPSRAATLVSGGIYRVSRNPMYLGMLLTLAGLAMYLSNLLALLVLPAFVAYMNRYQIVPEERALRARFGVPYDNYLRTVRRWL